MRQQSGSEIQEANWSGGDRLFRGAAFGVALAALLANSSLAADASESGPPAPPQVSYKVSGTQVSFALTNIARVFMHEPGHYSVLVQKGDELIPVDLHGWTISKNFLEKADPDLSRVSWKTQVRILADAKPSEAMKATFSCQVVRQNFLDPDDGLINITFHVHNPSDINAGGWTRQVHAGKSYRTESGQTQVVE